MISSDSLALQGTDAGVPTVTSLPGSPADGDEVYYQFNRGDGTNGYWHLRYNAGTTYWDYLGGPSLFAEVTANESTTSGTYAALTTAGPSVSLPLGGDYDIGIGNAGWTQGVATQTNPFMSYDIGGTGAVDSDAYQWSALNYGAGTISNAIEGSRQTRKTGLSAVTLTSKYKVTGGGTAFFGRRWMNVTPLRVH